MVITRISEFGIKVSQGSSNIAINPPVNKSDAFGGTFGADIALLSSAYSGFDSAEQFLKKDNTTFVIDSAGEYERDDMFIYGVATESKKDGNIVQNVAYYFNVDSIDILVLGAHEPDALPATLTELVDNVDVLILPIAGDTMLGPVAANKLATKLEASVVIPVGYSKKADNQIQAFSKEFSHEIVETSKLNLKSSDITEVSKAYVIL